MIKSFHRCPGRHDSTCEMKTLYTFLHVVFTKQLLSEENVEIWLIMKYGLRQCILPPSGIGINNSTIILTI